MENLKTKEKTIMSSHLPIPSFYSYHDFMGNYISSIHLLPCSLPARLF